MDENKINSYAQRIISATKTELIIITYELLLDCIGELKGNIESKEIKIYYRNQKKTLRVLDELRNSLDMEYDISKNLLKLYNYINQSIRAAGIKFTIEPLEDAQGILNILLDGYRIAKEEHKDEEKVIINHQKLYAGLTYGKEGLTESVGTEKNRGFDA